LLDDALDVSTSISLVPQYFAMSAAAEKENHADILLLDRQVSASASQKI
jgi:hypothetical protein